MSSLAEILSSLSTETPTDSDRNKMYHYLYDGCQESGLKKMMGEFMQIMATQGLKDSKTRATLISVIGVRVDGNSTGVSKLFYKAKEYLFEDIKKDKPLSKILKDYHLPQLPDLLLKQATDELLLQYWATASLAAFFFKNEFLTDEMVTRKNMGENIVLCTYHNSCNEEHIQWLQDDAGNLLTERVDPLNQAHISEIKTLQLAHMIDRDIKDPLFYKHKQKLKYENNQHQLDNVVNVAFLDLLLETLDDLEATVNQLNNQKIYGIQKISFEKFIQKYEAPIQDILTQSMLDRDEQMRAKGVFEIFSQQGIHTHTLLTNDYLDEIINTQKRTLVPPGFHPEYGQVFHTLVNHNAFKLFDYSSLMSLFDIHPYLTAHYLRSIPEDIKAIAYFNVFTYLRGIHNSIFLIKHIMTTSPHLFTLKHFTDYYTGFHDRTKKDISIFLLMLETFPENKNTAILSILPFVKDFDEFRKIYLQLDKTSINDTLQQEYEKRLRKDNLDIILSGRVEKFHILNIDHFFNLYDDVCQLNPEKNSVETTLKMLCIKLYRYNAISNYIVEAMTGKDKARAEKMNKIINLVQNSISDIKIYMPPDFITKLRRLPHKKEVISRIPSIWKQEITDSDLRLILADYDSIEITPENITDALNNISTADWPKRLFPLGLLPANTVDLSWIDAPLKLEEQMSQLTLQYNAHKRCKLSSEWFEDLTSAELDSSTIENIKNFRIRNDVPSEDLKRLFIEHFKNRLSEKTLSPNKSAEKRVW